MTSRGGEPYILCEELFKIYKIADLEVVALRGLDLKIDPGEVVAIVGASGSGKSTLMNILAGYDAPSAGRVTVGGKDLLRMSGRDAEEYRRTEVGFIWQQTSRNMFSYLTTLENVALPMMLTDVPVAERTSRAKELIELVGLGHRMDHTPDKLSGGEQQRVAIAIALANHPPLLLADEPTGELDSVNARAIFGLFEEMVHTQGISVVAATHDSTLLEMADQVLEMRDGTLSESAELGQRYRS